MQNCTLNPICVVLLDTQKKRQTSLKFNFHSECCSCKGTLFQKDRWVIHANPINKKLSGRINSSRSITSPHMHVAARSALPEWIIWAWNIALGWSMNYGMLLTFNPVKRWWRIPLTSSSLKLWQLVVLFFFNALFKVLLYPFYHFIFANEMQIRGFVCSSHVFHCTCMQL